MKIGLFIDTFYPMIDGVINVVDNYALHLSKYADVTVFCPLVDKTPIKNKPYKIVQCKSLSLKKYDYGLPLPAIDSAFMRELENSDLDIVHIHSPFTVGMIGKNYAKKKKIPLVATLHSQYAQDFEMRVKLKSTVGICMHEIMSVFNACDICFAVNDKIKELYQTEYGLTAPCEVVYNATDYLPVKSPEQSYKRIKKAYNLQADIPLYLFVGRITRLKGVDFIVRALKILKDKGGKFKMIFAGKGEDEQYLKEIIASLNMQKDIILAGRIEDKTSLADLYSSANLFLFPSLYDANSLVQIESASQSTPTLFLKQAKTACLIKDGFNGYLSDYDERAFADKILKIEEDKILYEEVCKNAFNTLYCTWENRVKEVYIKYLYLLERKQIHFDK